MRIDSGASLKLLTSFTKIDLPRESQAEVEIFSHTGKGSFSYGGFRFNSEFVLFRFVVDDVEIFNINVEDLKAMVGSNNTSAIASPLKFQSSKKIVEVSYPIPFEFYESVKVYAKANYDSGSRDFKSYIVSISNNREA